MVKTAKLRQAKASRSNRSRAAKRAASPTLVHNLDKSLLNIPRPSSPPPATPDSFPSFTFPTTTLNTSMHADPTSPTVISAIPLTHKQKIDKAISEISMRQSSGGTTGGSGVNKNTRPKRGQRLSSKQKKRREVGVMMAERVAARMERKVEGAKERGKVVETRKGNWDDLNDKIEVPVGAAVDMVIEMKMK